MHTHRASTGDQDRHPGSHGYAESKSEKETFMCTEVGRYPTKELRPHPRVEKATAGQGDSRGCEAGELWPPLSVYEQLGPWAMVALWGRLGPAPEGFRAGEFKP